MRITVAAALLAPLVLSVPQAARAEPPCHLTGRPWLEGRIVGTSGPSLHTVDARLGDEIAVFVVAPGRLGSRAVEFSEAPGKGRVSWEAAGCAPPAISWRRVEPRMQHVATAAPNAAAKVYANAVVFGPDHGKWIGFDRLEYFETSVEGDGPTLRVRGAQPSGESDLDRDGDFASLGTLRLAATVRADGQTLSTSGAEDAPDGLIADRVFRFTFRSGDGFLGWLTSYFNVPYLFGSAGKGKKNQAERYLGADCADVLVAALRRAGRRDLQYSSVAGLVDELDRVGAPTVIAPCSGKPECKRVAAPRLQFGKDVRPGDLLALDYVGFDGLPKNWDHIVAVVEDSGPDGKPDGLLGPEDLVADSGDSSGLKLAPLADQGTVRLQVLRARGVPGDGVP